MKTLTIVFMIHTLQEFGSLAEKIKEVHVQRRGVLGAREFFEEVDQYWEEVGRRIGAGGFFARKTAKNLAIFIDGLPNVDEQIVQKIVQEMIAQKIPAYLIIQKLEEAGASVYGTEDPRLLLEEHAIWTETAKEGEADPQRLKELLRERDEVMAKRIDDIVAETGQGLLFVGRAHDVASELEKLRTEFRVIYL
ncbi:MAG: hypothetical protein WAP23_02465 [Candidatus Spechtbacterales bacterium]